MERVKFSIDKKVPIVYRVVVPETLKNIPPGEKVHFSRQDLGVRDGTIHAAINRLNKKAGAKEFSMIIDDNDGSYWIKRKVCNKS